jgi:hypothetical protein
VQEAKDEYVRLLSLEPSHREALNNLGSLLFATRHTAAARIAFAQAVARHPGDPASRVNLGTLLFKTGELAAAREEYEQALLLDPANAQAHVGLSFVLASLGDALGAETHRRAGFEKRFVIPLPYRGTGPGVSVLQLVTTTDGNVRAENFLDDRVFRTFLVVPEFYDAHTPLPAHQLVFNAIGDVEAASDALRAAASVLSVTNAPVINPPSVVMRTSRSEIARRISRIPGVVTAATATVPRELLTGPDAPATLTRHGIGFPLLVRTPGFHTGQHFLRVEHPDSLPAAVAELPGPELIVMQYLDARGADGRSRKYRVMVINGRLYPLHAAISSDWKIHYFTAEMAEHPAHRAEDAAFVSDMARVLGDKAMRALEGIQATLALDYGGIDFGVNSRGEILLFEANATMVVNPPEADERWAYRRPAIERIFRAVEAMLLERARPLDAPTDAGQAETPS